MACSTIGIPFTSARAKAPRTKTQAAERRPAAFISEVDVRVSGGGSFAFQLGHGLIVEALRVLRRDQSRKFIFKV